MRDARPDSVPPVPATNSATTAPIKARPPEIRKPARKYGKADGKRSHNIVCHLDAPYSLNRSQRFASVLFSPVTVLDTTGKNATIQAQINRASVVSFAQIMISGAMETTGVTCRMTA